MDGLEMRGFPTDAVAEVGQEAAEGAADLVGDVA